MRVIKELMRELYRKGVLWGEIAKEMGLTVDDIMPIAKEIIEEEKRNQSDGKK